MDRFSISPTYVQMDVTNLTFLSKERNEKFVLQKIRKFQIYVIIVYMCYNKM